ncbi:MAG: hypothetical protein K6C99_07730 [Lachnospiraceae bacterium]|nr:hypothetical protein [Lachnospiraceae bacterium]
MSAKRNLKLSAEGIIIIALAVIFMLSVVTHYQDYTFWYDELCTISFVRLPRSLGELLHIFLTDEVTNLPLYDVILWFWYRIVPHTEGFLLFPNLIFYITGVLCLTGVLKKVTGNDRAGLLFVFFAFANPFAVKSVINELRAYALLYMLASVTLMQFIPRIPELGAGKEAQADEKRAGELTGYSVSLLLLSFTHYFGVLFAAELFAVELFMRIKRKKGRSFAEIIAVYMIPLALCGAWVISAMTMKRRNIDSFWVDVPGIREIFGTVNSICGHIPALTLFIALMMIIYILFVIISKRKTGDVRLAAMLSVLVILIFAAVLIYSVVISRSGGLFVQRYFTVIMPALQMTEALALYALAEGIAGKIKKDAGWISLLAPVPVICVMILCGAKEFKYAYTEYIVDGEDAEDIHDEEVDVDPAEVLVILERPSDIIDEYGRDGWAEFYLRDRGYRTVWEEDAALLRDYDRVSVYPVDLDEDLDPVLFEGYTEGPDGFWKREK